MPRDDFEKVNVWRFVGAAFLASLAVYVALRSTWLLEIGRAHV